MARRTKKAYSCIKNGGKSIENDRHDIGVQHSRINSRENSPNSHQEKMKNVATQTAKQLFKLTALKIVAIILILGLTYSVVRNLLDYLEIDMCSEKEFYQFQKTIEPNVIQMAKDSAKKYAEKIKDDTIISLDGAWDHRRHGTSCIVTFIDISTRKIIDFEIKTQHKQFVIGDTKEPSKNLEKECVIKLVERWKSSEKVKFYIHDNDGVTRNIIEKSGWKVTEILDIGHAVKAIKNNLNNFNQKNGKPFKKLKPSIERFLEQLLRNETISQDERLKLYLNMPYHYVGNHTSCIHKEDGKFKQYTGKDKDDFIAKFNKFLEENVHYPQKVRPFYNTQNNECFNELKTKFLSKNRKFSSSTEMRLSEAVLEWNEEDWDDELLKNLGCEPICSCYRQMIKGRKDTQKKKNKKKCTTECKEKRKLERRAKEKKKKAENDKADGYKPKKK